MTMKIYYTLVVCMMVGVSAYAMEENHYEQDSSNTSMARAIVAGAGAGCVEVGFVGHVCSYLVNQAIRNNKFTLDPKQWNKAGYVSLLPKHVYSGVGMNLASMAPITALQNALTEQFVAWYKSSKRRELSEVETLVPPVCAGAVAAVAVATPTERIPNYMQKVITETGRKLSSWQATRELVSHHGITTPWRGVTSTALRDGIFTCGYKTLPQMMYNVIAPTCGDNAGTKMTASVLAGVMTAFVTQPMQVIARYMQNNNEVGTSWDTCKEIYRNEGMKGLWKGAVPRGIRVMVAIPVLSYSEKSLSNLLKDASQ